MSAKAFNSYMVLFKLADGTERPYASIYGSEAEAHAMVANPIREHIAPSCVYRVVPAVWPDDWRKYDTIVP